MSSEFKERGKIIVKDFSQQINEEVLIQDYESLKKEVNELLQTKDILFVEIFDMDERRLASKSLTGDIIEEPKKRGMIETVEIRNIDIDDFAKINGIEVISPILYDNNYLGYINVGISFDRINYEVNSKIFFLFVIIFCFIVICFILSFLFSNYLTKPIRALMEATDRIARGELDDRIDLISNDEMGILANSFDLMREAIRNQKRELKEANFNLEKKVEERTKELQNREQKVVSINRKLEEANVRLTKLDKEKDEFISIAAHELKTPLTSIKGFTQLMSKGKILKDKKKSLYYLDMVNKNTDRLYELILDLVDSSRLSLGKLVIEITDVKVSDIFDEIKNTMAVVIQEKGITPVFKIEKGLPKIKADPERLLQVIRNLIVNATHFTKVGGTITLDMRRKGRYVQFSVKDTGEGIPKDKQNQIFSRFYQADTSLTRKVKGSGLGLSVCKGLVELMKGKIWFESEEGKGSTFYFTIALAK